MNKVPSACVCWEAKAVHLSYLLSWQLQDFLAQVAIGIQKPSGSGRTDD